MACDGIFPIRRAEITVIYTTNKTDGEEIAQKTQCVRLHIHFIRIMAKYIAFLSDWKLAKQSIGSV